MARSERGSNQRKREQRRNDLSQSRRREKTWLEKNKGFVIGGGIVAAVILLVGWAIFNQFTASRNFTFTTYQGHEQLGVSSEGATFDQVLGQGKPVVLNFWGGSCPPCRAEMPDFQAQHERLGDQAHFFGLDVGPFLGLGTRTSAQELLRELNISYPTAYPEGSPISAYGISSLPQTIFYDAEGNEVRREGFLSAARLNRILTNDLGLEG